MRVYQLILLYYGGCTVCRQVSQNYSGFDMITGDQTPYVFLIGNVFIVVWWWLTGVASVVVVVEYHWSGMFPSVHDESGFQVIWITSWKLYSSFFKREVYLLASYVHTSGINSFSDFDSSWRLGSFFGCGNNMYAGDIPLLPWFVI